MIEATTPEIFIESDYDFHGTIIKGSGNSVYVDIYATLRSFMHLEIKRAFESAVTDRLDKVHTEHERILVAVKKRILEDAILYLNNHIDHIEQRVEKSFHIDR
jgi:DNA-binding FadR family transcriptional regulator